MALFKVSKKIKVGDFEFNELGMEDSDIYYKYLLASPFDTNMWNMNFTYVFTFNDSNTRKVLWQVINDMLCIFVLGNDEKLSLLHIPIGACDRKQLNNTILKCLKMCAKVNGKTVYDCEIREVSDVHKDWIMEKYFKLNKSSFGLEHHYDIERTASLEGSDFKYVRRKIRKFEKEYPDAKWREANEADWDGLLQLQRAWEETAGEKYFRIIDATYYRCAIKNCEELKHRIFVVTLHNRIIGMISGAILPTGQGWCFLRKPLNNYDGLSEYLIWKLCDELKGNGAQLLNDGGDGNSKGLRFFKERFNPVQSPAIYSLKYKKQK